MRLELPRQSLEKYLNIKFYVSPFSGSGFAPCGKTHIQTDGKTYMTKLIFAISDLANAHKKLMSSIVTKAKISTQ